MPNHPFEWAGIGMGGSEALFVVATVLVIVAFVARRISARIIVRARSTGALAMPNERSSHVRPTPQSGGLAIMAGTLCGLLLLWAASLVHPVSRGLWPLAAAVVLGFIGWIDDRRGLGRLGRLLVQAAAAFTLVIGLWRADASDPMSTVVIIVLIGIGAVWWLNLFNFMDGIDGIAAAQAMFMLLAAAGLMAATRAPVDAAPAWTGTLSALGYSCVAATAGFLTMNWAPARLFMGDAGSLFLGYVVLVEAVASVATGRLNAWVWLILGASFIVDATTTLLHRLASGQRFVDAHRSHVYQRLARHWRSHARVTLAYTGVNVLALLPLAGWASLDSDAAPWIAAAALSVLAGVAVRLGAGHPGDLAGPVPATAGVTSSGTGET